MEMDRVIIEYNRFLYLVKYCDNRNNGCMCGYCSLRRKTRTIKYFQVPFTNNLLTTNQYNVTCYRKIPFFSMFVTKIEQEVPAYSIVLGIQRESTVDMTLFYVIVDNIKYYYDILSNTFRTTDSKLVKSPSFGYIDQRMFGENHPLVVNDYTPIGGCMIRTNQGHIHIIDNSYELRFWIRPSFNYIDAIRADLYCPDTNLSSYDVINCILHEDHKVSIETTRVHKGLQKRNGVNNPILRYSHEDFNCGQPILDVMIVYRCPYESWVVAVGLDLIVVVDIEEQQHNIIRTGRVTKIAKSGDRHIKVIANSNLYEINLKTLAVELLFHGIEDISAGRYVPAFDDKPSIAMLKTKSSRH